MGMINSPIGKQQFESGRSFVVEDLSQDGGPGFNSPEARMQAHLAQQQQAQPEPQPQMSVDELTEMRRRKIAEAHGITNEARQRLEIVLGFGRAIKNVTIEAENGTVTYSLRTLKGWEQKRIVALAEQADKAQTIEATYPIRNTTVAFALYAVDNIDIDLLLGATALSREEKIAARLGFVEELDDQVTRYLFEQHQVLVRENSLRFQTPEDVKEVAEQIKKSSGNAGP